MALHALIPTYALQSAVIEFLGEVIKLTAGRGSMTATGKEASTRKKTTAPNERQHFFIFCTVIFCQGPRLRYGVH